MRCALSSIEIHTFTFPFSFETAKHLHFIICFSYIYEKSVHACIWLRSPGSGHPSLQGWTICTEMPPACHLEHNMQFVWDINLFFRVDRFILRRPSPLHMMYNGAQCTVSGPHLLWGWLLHTETSHALAHDVRIWTLQYGVHIFSDLRFVKKFIRPDFRTTSFTH